VISRLIDEQNSQQQVSRTEILHRHTAGMTKEIEGAMQLHQHGRFLQQSWMPGRSQGCVTDQG
jgi:hypothetical protein